jgi:hypothetical protein
MKVTFEADVADERKLYWFLDWMLTFERLHRDEVHLRVLVEGGDQQVDEVWKMFERLGLDVKFAARRP